MSLPHFFLDDQVIATQEDSSFELQLSEEDGKHARVLRLRAGEHIAVIDADSDYFECKIESFDGPMIVSVCGHGSPLPDMPHVTLVQGLAKGDKMDAVIRHATELGIERFVPLACDRSVVKLDAKKGSRRLERWNSIARSAAMQSGRMSLPEITEPMDVGSLCRWCSGFDCVLVCWEESEGEGIGEALDECLHSLSVDFHDARVAVVVGPEGGLTSQEVERLKRLEFVRVVTLGQTILRTETAGIVAPALVLYQLGGLQ